MAERPKSEKELREQRLQAALRENLKRRKAQARGRAEDAEQPGRPATPKPHDSAGFAAEKDSG